MPNFGASAVVVSDGQVLLIYEQYFTEIGQVGEQIEVDGVSIG